ncbi:MAG: tyrosine-type recombinase/integrase [Pseudomonadales bacterium]|nr:tyrosine-type recombinase/integrase [Pseudomonadales bacterium]
MSKRPAETYTRDEINTLLSQCNTRYATGLRDKALIMILWRSGLRINEALELRLKDIHFQESEIRVLHGKGERARTVGLDVMSADVLRLWIERRRAIVKQPGTPLFCSTTGNKLHQANVRKMLNRRAAKAGIEKRVHPHGFRHTYSQELVRENTNVKYIQQLLGHASLATTDTYLQGLGSFDAVELSKNRV